MARSTVLFIAILVAIIHVCSALVPGYYMIQFKGDFLTDPKQDGEYVYLSQQRSDRSQIWEVSPHQFNEYTISNSKTDLYLTFGGTPYPELDLLVSSGRRTWKLSPASNGGYFIETSDPYMGTSLLAEKSSKFWPPHVALAMPRKDQRQIWKFIPTRAFDEQPRQHLLPYKKAGLCHS
ncbi:hypothetical protein BGW38_007583 [Lunasporangiospora selenospora]|uniref:Ricin B lectin domain-containing protein n=1 Tax=Lunasporangiospora selenospora TaxID=979761 RepID=A0A9P6G0K8_9FUNG|nr:hypothetical protein BGW38_007583 [Lunasporangiospora selenospora]